MFWLFWNTFLAKCVLLSVHAVLFTLNSVIIKMVILKKTFPFFSTESNGNFNIKASSGYKFGCLAKIVNYMKVIKASLLLRKQMVSYCLVEIIVFWLQAEFSWTNGVIIVLKALKMF